MLKIYNSLSQKKEIFVSLIKNKVRMYVCGMTVYDDCHLGHARVGIVFDMINRWLKELGYGVTFVRNITDVDDKIINKAIEENVDIFEISNRYINSMKDDFKSLNIIRPDYEPRVTEYIDKIIEFIYQLLNKNMAYISNDGSVYFSIKSFPEYGKLNNRNNKENESDFVLWKTIDDNSYSWTSPWGRGRPGWHIECSTMSRDILGNRFDIHGGGLDLKFPHHENEIAQSEALLGDQHVSYWIHNGHVSVNNNSLKTVMSKSKGNSITIKSLLEKYNSNVIRYYILLTHYRKPLIYSEKAIKNAEKSYKKITNLLYNLDLSIKIENGDEDYNYWYMKFATAMNDDFNTPKVISILFELIHKINNTNITAEKNKLGTILYKLLKILGIIFDIDFIQYDKNEYISQLIEERNIARKEKNWNRSDEIRNQLKDIGIIISDEKFN
ncbi:MAG: cysteine--tRNA ligase [Nanoarchaeota archaeon]|nr:cysteine--tRNA ligase [Nanoarchaeota archaeon]